MAWFKKIFKAKSQTKPRGPTLEEKFAAMKARARDPSRAKRTIEEAPCYASWVQKKFFFFVFRKKFQKKMVRVTVTVFRGNWKKQQTLNLNI